MRAVQWDWCLDRSCLGILFGFRTLRDYAASIVTYAVRGDPRICPMCACPVTQSSGDAITVEPYVFHAECFKCHICALRVSPSAKPQIRSGGQRVSCQKCVKNGYRPTQPLVSLSVIQGRNRRSSSPASDDDECTEVSVTSRRSSSASESTPLTTKSTEPEESGGTNSQCAPAEPLPVPSLSEYLEAAEESLEAATVVSSSSSSSQASSAASSRSTTPLLPGPNTFKRVIDEDAILGEPKVSFTRPSARTGTPKARSSPSRTAMAISPKKTSPLKTSNEAIAMSAGKDQEFDVKGSGKRRSFHVRHRRSLDTLFLNPEVVGREDDVDSGHDEDSDAANDLSSSDDDIPDVPSSSTSVKIDVKAASRSRSKSARNSVAARNGVPAHKRTFSARNTANSKAVEHILDFKQEALARDARPEFQDSDLGAELRQLEEIGVPGAHLEKIAAALGETSFVSLSQHRRYKSEGALKHLRPSRLPKSPRGDFSGVSSNNGASRGLASGLMSRSSIFESLFRVPRPQHSLSVSEVRRDVEAQRPRPPANDLSRVRSEISPETSGVGHSRHKSSPLVARWRDLAQPSENDEISSCEPNLHTKLNVHANRSLNAPLTPTHRDQTLGPEPAATTTSLPISDSRFHRVHPTMTRRTSKIASNSPASPYRENSVAIMIPEAAPHALKQISLSGAKRA